MKLGRGKYLLLATLCVVVLSAAGWAQIPCGLPSEIYCQPWDGTGNLVASQNDTNAGGFGNFATVYDNFTLKKTWDVESFHFVGGYFNVGPPPFVTAFTLNFYNDAAGAPGGLIATGFFTSFNETLISGQIYSYDLFFKSFNLGPGTFWASVVPDLGFPPQWGWATGTGGDGIAFQAFFSPPVQIANDFAFALDGTPVSPTPEPGTMVMLGTGILGLAGALRRKLL
jgi:PEP-CTERM motif